jgi:hypothetical protein
MASWIWVLIPIVAIVGAYIIDYQKNKLKWQVKNNQSEKELKEVREIVHQLKRRIENLEAIAANDDGTLNISDPAGMIEVDEAESIKKEHEYRIAKMAESKGS